MELVLEIISGPDQGKRFTITEGFTIGRKRGDLILQDTKASGLHASFTKDEHGRWLAIDQNSVNGLRLEGRRFTSIAMTQDLVFQIGNTRLKVVQSPSPAVPVISPIAALPAPAKTWRDHLGDWFADQVKGLKNVKPHKQNIRTFKSIVELEFTTGPQLDTRWTFGYGPRKVGSECLEFQIWDETAPAICFVLKPNDLGQCVLITKEPEVTVNEQFIAEVVLKVGDVIGVNLIRLHVLTAPM